MQILCGVLRWPQIVHMTHCWQVQPPGCLWGGYQQATFIVPEGVQSLHMYNRGHIFTTMVYKIQTSMHAGVKPHDYFAASAYIEVMLHISAHAPIKF